MTRYNLKTINMITSRIREGRYNLVINSRDQEELSISKEGIIRAGNNSTRIVTFPGDISEEDVCIDIIKTAAQEFGTIDVLVMLVLTVRKKGLQR